jgi:hypothetical protein
MLPRSTLSPADNACAKKRRGVIEGASLKASVLLFSVTAASPALAAEGFAGLTVQAPGVGLLRAAQQTRPLARTRRRGLSGSRGWIRGIAEAGTRRLPIDPDARARRDLGRLTESRAAGQQGRDSDDRKDSTDFHGNVPSLNRIRRPERRMTEAGVSLFWERTSAAKLAN